SSNLHLASGIAPIGEAIRRGCRVALGVDASALDEDDDIVRELRLGHFLHGGWGFEPTIGRGGWLEKTVADGRFANGAPGDGARAPFLDAWGDVEPAVTAHYRSAFGCC